MISIHAPARGATLYRLLPMRSIWTFQSTLPRGERPVSEYTAVTITGISIHAPARGATPQHFAVHSLFEISIHAPARGATRNGDRETNASGNFNPRSREGSDKNAGGHVLAELHFNPRSREGSDFYWFTIIQHMISAY